MSKEGVLQIQSSVSWDTRGKGKQNGLTRQDDLTRERILHRVVRRVIADRHFKALSFTARFLKEYSYHLHQMLLI